MEYKNTMRYCKYKKYIANHLSLINAESSVLSEYGNIISWGWETNKTPSYIADRIAENELDLYVNQKES